MMLQTFFGEAKPTAVDNTSRVNLMSPFAVGFG